MPMLFLLTLACAPSPAPTRSPDRPAPPAELCTGGVDDDGDGWVDCADPDCDGRCPEVCGDGRDNDADGAVDCADRDCLGLCPEACDDGWDNDGNGLADCLDPACAHPGCVERCDDGRDNDADGAVDCADLDCRHAACPEVCGDGADNDADGLTDCADPDCTGCPEVCGDGLDNDGDGRIDCADPDCDGDGDGRCGADDCDDTDPAVHRGAPEVCNGDTPVDDDCDGQVDEADASLDLSTLTVVFRDADGDGFGTRGDRRRACAVPAGFTTVPGDCDDRRATTHPDAVEVCNVGNPVDDDCDGDVDDDDDSLQLTSARAWYPDADGDGLGDARFPRWACTRPDDHVAVAGDCDPALRYITGPVLWYADADGDGFPGVDDPIAPVPSCDPPAPGAAPAWRPDDCDDADDTVHPDAEELCFDGVDSDCDGRECGPRRASLATADAMLTGEAVYDHAGTALGAAGDVNGDGFDDLLVGADLDDRGGEDAGAVYLVHGPVHGEVSLATAALVLIGTPEDDIGDTMAGVGDLDGDGFDDLLVGAQWNDLGGANAGAAFVVYGPETGALPLGTVPDVLIGEADGDYAGLVVGSAGDADGDGLGDLLVAAPRYSGVESLAGAVYVVTEPVRGLTELASSHAVVLGDTHGDTLGYAIEGRRDVNGDGQVDVLVGGKFSGRGGLAHLFYGPLVGPVDVTSAAAVIEGGDYDYAGSAVSAGDLDDDGADDLVIGASGANVPRTGMGAVYIWYDAPSGHVATADADAALHGVETSDSAGREVDATGDLDGDGFADLVIGATGFGAQMGTAYLVFGPVFGTVGLEEADLQWAGELDGDWAGIAVDVVGDVDADGRPDLAIGASLNDRGAPASGTAYLFYGPIE